MSTRDQSTDGGERAAKRRAQLRGYTPADTDEARHLQRMRALIEGPGDCFDRHHFSPGHFTASAFVISRDHGQLLLILHGKLGLWLQPGGHVDPADTDAEQAARREVREETGLEDVRTLGDGPFDLDVHAIPALGGHPPHEHHDVRFLFEADVARASAGSDARDARLFAVDALDGVGTDRSVMRAVEKIRARF